MHSVQAKNSGEKKKEIFELCTLKSWCIYVQIRVQMKRRLESDYIPAKRQRTIYTSHKRKQHFDMPPAKRTRQIEEDVLRRHLVEAYTKIEALEQRIKELEYVCSLNQQQNMNTYIPCIECY